MGIAFRIVHGKSSNVGTNYHDVNGEYCWPRGRWCINSRIAKVNKNGNWIESWGRTRRPTGTVQQSSRYCSPCGGSRLRGRSRQSANQVFDGEGKFVRQIMIDMPFNSNASPAIGNKPILPIKGPQTMAPGSPWAICITPVLVEARGLSSRNRTGVALDTIAADHGPDSLGSLRAGVWACAEGNTLSRHSLRTP